MVVVARNPFWAGQPEVPSEPVRGDVNGDGRVSVADAPIALRIALDLEKASEYQLRIGDLDGNGKIDVSDAAKILRGAIGLERL